MKLFENKIWEVDQQPDFLKLTFYGKYTEGLKMLTWALVGFEVVLLMLITLFAIEESGMFLIIVVIVIMLVFAFIIRLNLQTRNEKHLVTITADKVILVKTNGKKTIMKELIRSEVQGVKMINPPHMSDGVDILLLIISPILWFVVGAGMKDPKPAVYNATEAVPFFEFGKLNEKNAVISFLNDYLGKQNPAPIL